MTDTILTFEDRFSERTLEEHAARHPSSFGHRQLPKPLDPTAAPAVVVVNHGRWVALCPENDGGAEYVSFDRPEFFCCECRNGSIGRHRRPLLIPDGRNDIEAALLERPDVRTRNWLPGETVDDLRRENKEHGL